MDPIKRGARRLAFPALLALIVIGFYWKLVLTKQFTWLESPDLAYQTMPWLDMQARAWHQGVFPAWDPYVYGGQPLVGQLSPGAAYPPNWLLFLQPLRDGHLRQSALHWYFVLIHLIGALSCYALCRDLKRSQGASMVAGVAFGLGGAVAALDWPQILNGAVWAPLVFLFLLRAVRGRRPWTSAALSGFFLGLSWLAGHHQVPLFFTLAAAAVWVVHIAGRGRVDGKRLRLAMLSAAIAVLASGLQTLPAYEYGKHSRRFVSDGPTLGWKQPVPYTMHREYSSPPTTLIGIVVPGVFRNTNPHLGFVVVSLAFLAVAVSSRHPHVRLFTLVALGGILLALGPHSVIHGVLYALIPLVEKARSPSMALAVFSLGAAVLAAYGLDGVGLRRSRPWLARLRLGLVITGGAILLMVLGILTARKMAFDIEERVALAGIFALAAAALLGMRKARGALAACALLLALVEIGNTSGFAFAHRDEAHRTGFLRQLNEDRDILAFLRRQPGSFRVEVDGRQIPYNYGEWNGIDTYDAYITGLLENVLRLDLFAPRTRMLYGNRYSLRREPDLPGQREVFSGSSGVKVYENPGAFARVWTVHEAVRIPNREPEIRQMMADANFDLARKTFLAGAVPKLESCAASDDARLVERGLNHLTIDVTMACTGMLVASENIFPGWRATVDGAPAELHAAYTVFRGVVVPAGRHRVEMRYRPMWLYAGALFSALSVLLMAAIAWWERRREANAK
jgi:hypothetical protein